MLGFGQSPLCTLRPSIPTRTLWVNSVTIPRLLMSRLRASFWEVGRSEFLFQAYLPGKMVKPRFKPRQSIAISTLMCPWIIFSDDEIGAWMTFCHFEDWEGNKSISKIKTRCVVSHHSLLLSSNFSGFLGVKHCSRILGHQYRKKKVLAFKVSYNPWTVALLR